MKDGIDKKIYEVEEYVAMKNWPTGLNIRKMSFESIYEVQYVTNFTTFLNALKTFSTDSYLH